MVSYTYDTWGKLESTSGTLAGTVGADNPFRYRGYYYDTETELYYLNARYYNPTWGRFISADNYGGATGELLSHNMFAYCANNPVMASDPSGHKPIVNDYNCYGYALSEAFRFHRCRTIQPGQIADPDSKLPDNYTLDDIDKLTTSDINKLGGWRIGTGTGAENVQIGDDYYRIARMSSLSTC